MLHIYEAFFSLLKDIISILGNTSFQLGFIDA